LDGGTATYGGGGGGGGYYGGGGGGYSSGVEDGGNGGGGGSGYGPAGVVFQTGVHLGHGLVRITYATPETSAPTTTIALAPAAPTARTAGMSPACTPP
jgi:hypothetical protein